MQVIETKKNGLIPLFHYKLIELTYHFTKPVIIYWIGVQSESLIGDAAPLPPSSTQKSPASKTVSPLHYTAQQNRLRPSKTKPESSPPTKDQH